MERPYLLSVFVNLTEIYCRINKRELWFGQRSLEWQKKYVGIEDSGEMCCSCDGGVPGGGGTPPRIGFELYLVCCGDEQTDRLDRNLCGP